MKKLMKIAQTRTEEIEVEVEFPVYSQHYIDGDGYSTTIFRRMEHDGTCYAITRNHDRFEIEIEKRAWDSRSSLDYLLGRGEYACTPGEFEEARLAAVAYVKRIPARSSHE